MKRKILLALLVIVVVGGIIGYRMYSKKVTNYADETPQATLTATDLVAAFDKDTAAAGKAYLDKIVRVSGRVKTLDSSAVVLGEDGNPSEVVVGLDDRNLKGLSGLKVGETAVLQGKVSGYNKAGSGEADDLIASLGGTTVKIDYAGVKTKN